MKNADQSVSLKEYIESRLTSIERATQLAYQNLQVRLDNMNEWRHTVEDQSNRFVTRREFEQVKQLVYMGLGMVLLLEVLLKFFLK